MAGVKAPGCHQRPHNAHSLPHSAFGTVFNCRMDVASVDLVCEDNALDAKTLSRALGTGVVILSQLLLMCPVMVGKAGLPQGLKPRLKFNALSTLTCSSLSHPACEMGRQVQLLLGSMGKVFTESLLGFFSGFIPRLLGDVCFFLSAGLCSHGYEQLQAGLETPLPTPLLRGQILPLVLEVPECAGPVLQPCQLGLGILT
ncbi:hypothetical protein J0S82_017249, partial [Galemys pyrenaicus]